MNFLHDQAVDHCLLSIKRRCKAKGITYAKIAEAMAVSEITVKRMLNQKDISLKKLMALADLAECDLTELMKEGFATKTEFQCFTDKQDKAFCKYPHLFQFYVYLIREMQPKDIAQNFKLDGTSMQLYLSTLEKLRLIRLKPDQSVQIPKNPFITFSSNSLFIKNYMLETLNKISNEYRKSKPDEKFLMGALWVYEKDVEKLSTEITSLLSKYMVDIKDNLLNLKVQPYFQFIFAGLPNQPIPKVDLVKVKIGDLKV